MHEQTLVIVAHKQHALAADGSVKVAGGFFAITNEIAKHFARVRLCVPCRAAVEGATDRYRSNVEVVALPYYDNRVELMRRLPRIVGMLRPEMKRADVVYAMGPNDLGVVGMVLAWMWRRPFFVSLDTDRARTVLTRNYGIATRYLKHYFNRALLYPLIRLVCRDVPAFVTGNLFIGSAAHWRQWIKSTVRADDMLPMKAPRSRASTDTAHIVFVGRLSSEKNIGVLLEAVHLLTQRARGLRVSIVGDGPELESLKEQTRMLGLDNVHFTGRKPNATLIQSRFLDADALVLPSKEETQGKVLLEAMACSVPVVAARAGGIPAVITDRGNGLLFDPNSAQELAQTLDLLLFQDGSLCARLVENGFEYARTHALDVEVARLVGDVIAWLRTRG